MYVLGEFSWREETETKVQGWAGMGREGIISEKPMLDSFFSFLCFFFFSLSLFYFCALKRGTDPPDV